MKKLLPIIGLITAFCWFGCTDEKDEPSDKKGPTSFSLIFLENNEIDVTLTPRLIWEQATQAGSSITYSLYLDRAVDVAEGERPSTLVKEGLAQAFYVIEQQLLLATEYKWHVVATDKDGNTTESNEVFSFKTTGDIAANSPPNKFDLLQPIDGFVDASLTPSLSWQTAVDPDGHKVTYDVYMGTAPNPNTMIVFNSSTTNFSIPNELEYETTYYWWVMAIDEKGAWRNSVTFSFRTIEKPDSSSPGPLKWKKKSSSAIPLYTGRAGHQVVEKDGKLWLLSGKVSGTNAGNKNDVWTYDGTNWTEIKGHDDDFLDSYYQSDQSQVVTFNNELWLFAGTRNNIYKSADGISWENVSVNGSTIDTTHWKGKQGHQVVVFKDKMYVLGGSNGGITTNDVWSSSDGVNWEKIIVYEPNKGFTARRHHSAIVFNDKIWLIGGLVNGTNANDIWSSVDGLNWTKEVESAAFSPRSEMDLAVYKDNLVLIGGSRNKDIWLSKDGITWTEGNIPADYVAREQHQCITLGDKLYVIFGKDGPTFLNDVWEISW